MPDSRLQAAVTDGDARVGLDGAGPLCPDGRQDQPRSQHPGSSAAGVHAHWCHQAAQLQRPPKIAACGTATLTSTSVCPFFSHAFLSSVSPHMHAPHDVLYVYSGHDLSDADRCVQSDSHELNIYPPVSPSPRLPVQCSPDLQLICNCVNVYSSFSSYPAALAVHSTSSPCVYDADRCLQFDGVLDLCLQGYGLVQERDDETCSYVYS